MHRFRREALAPRIGGFARRVAWFLVPLLLSVVRRVIPAGDHVLVAGSPPEEGNAVEVVRALLAGYGGRVYWVNAPSEAYRRSVGLPPTSRLRPTPGQADVRTLWRYLSAQAVFVTHGLYGMPTPSRRKPVVNVWHGEQVKAGGPLFPFRRRGAREATFLLSSSKVLAAEKLARSNGLAEEDVIWVGNPRVDQFDMPVSDESLRQLGIPASRPFVIWLPTWRRRAGAAKDAAWINTRDLDGDSRVASALAHTVLPVLAEHDVTLVVKAHPLDAESRHIEGAVVLTDDELRHAGVPLYALLGCSAGLISDYSSVVVDYLQLDRPIGVFAPDAAGYGAGRGLTLAGSAMRPGHRLDAQGAAEAFVEDVLAAGALTAQQRESCRDDLGLWSRPNASESLLAELVRRGVSLRGL